MGSMLLDKTPKETNWIIQIFKNQLLEVKSNISKMVRRKNTVPIK